MSNFDGNIDPIPAWPDVPQLSTDAQLLGGTGGPMNAQAEALTARTSKLMQDKAEESDLANLSDITADAAAAAAEATNTATAAQQIAEALSQSVADANTASIAAVNAANAAAVSAAKLKPASDIYAYRTLGGF